MESLHTGFLSACGNSKQREEIGPCPACLSCTALWLLSVLTKPLLQAVEQSGPVLCRSHLALWYLHSGLSNWGHSACVADQDILPSFCPQHPWKQRSRLLSVVSLLAGDVCLQFPREAASVQISGNDIAVISSCSHLSSLLVWV